jgi:hypothetical protein
MSRRIPLLLRLGLAPLCITLLIGCLLLVGNGVLISSLYHSRSPYLPEFWRNARVAQAVLFVGPVLLLAFQWLAFDILVDWIRPMKYEPRDRRMAGPGK